MAPAWREAFLLHESQYFDKAYATPPPAIHWIFLWAFVALIVFVFYKGIALIAFKILSAFSEKSDAVQN